MTYRYPLPRLPFFRRTICITAPAVSKCSIGPPYKKETEGNRVVRPAGRPRRRATHLAMLAPLLDRTVHLHTPGLLRHRRDGCRPRDSVSGKGAASRYYGRGQGAGLCLGLGSDDGCCGGGGGRGGRPGGGFEGQEAQVVGEPGYGGRAAHAARDRESARHGLEGVDGGRLLAKGQVVHVDGDVGLRFDGNLQVAGRRYKWVFKG